MNWSITVCLIIWNCWCLLRQMRIPDLDVSCRGLIDWSISLWPEEQNDCEMLRFEGLLQQIKNNLNGRGSCQCRTEANAAQTVQRAAVWAWQFEGQTNIQKNNSIRQFVLRQKKGGWMITGVGSTFQELGRIVEESAGRHPRTEFSRRHAEWEHADDNGGRMTKIQPPFAVFWRMNGGVPALEIGPVVPVVGLARCFHIVIISSCRLAYMSKACDKASPRRCCGGVGRTPWNRCQPLQLCSNFRECQEKRQVSLSLSLYNFDSNCFRWMCVNSSYDGIFLKQAGWRGGARYLG